MNTQNYIKKIFSIDTESKFNDYALQLFHYQYKKIEIYNNYVNLICNNINEINTYYDIPFLPIELFRTKKIKAQNTKHQTIFHSSGTTNSEKSKHYIIDLEIYKKSIVTSFNSHIGKPENFVFFCLVPDSTKNPHSSLSFMCNEFIIKSKYSKSGFYIGHEDEMKSAILDCQNKKEKFIVFGLSIEILKFAEKYKLPLKNGLVIETGGAKKGSQNIIKEELYNRLKHLFKIKNIYSEYGMAELLSQSYCTESNYFKPPPWKKILIREKRNPLKINKNHTRGPINIIDLANVYSCGFIATNDFGYTTQKGFNIVGRNQNAIARGCNLMT